MIRLNAQLHLITVGRKLTTISKLLLQFPLSLSTLPQCSSIFSIKIPYPFLESYTRTWVTAPMNFPFCIIGLPLIP